MPIRILGKGLPAVGFCKIGEPDSAKDPQRKGAPQKWDHFELTGRERDAHGKLCVDVDITLALLRAQSHDGKPALRTCGGCSRSKWLAEQIGVPEFEHGLPVELPVLLPYDDLELNLPHRLVYYKGGTAFCTGDGESAQRLEIKGTRKVDGRDVEDYGAPKDWSPCGNACPDFNQQNGKRPNCMPTARLRFLLGLQASVGGCYEFRTRSWNSIRNLVESFEMIQTVTGGSLAWIPLWLEVGPQTVQPRSGRANTAWIVRASYRGTPQKLLEEVRGNLQLRAPILREIRQLEAMASREWKMTPEEIADLSTEAGDVIDMAPVAPPAESTREPFDPARHFSDEEMRESGIDPKAADEAFAAPLDEPPATAPSAPPSAPRTNGTLTNEEQNQVLRVLKEAGQRSRKDMTPILRQALAKVGRKSTREVLRGAELERLLGAIRELTAP